MIAMLRRYWSRLLSNGAPARLTGISTHPESVGGKRMEHRTENETHQEERNAPKSAAEVTRKERVRAALTRVTTTHAEAIKRLADR